MKQNEFEIDAEQNQPEQQRIWELMMKATQIEIPDMFGSGSNEMTPEEKLIAAQKREVKIVLADHEKCTKCKHSYQSHKTLWCAGKKDEQPYYWHHCERGCNCKQFASKKKTIKVCEDGIII